MRESLRLGVNIDHVATLRQARGTSYPEIVEAARICEQAGACGITVHLREDRRHIQDADVYALRRSLTTRLNLEMAIHPEIVGIALDVLPDEVCLVPERREEMTTECGLDAVGQRAALAPVIGSLTEQGVAVSLFIDADPAQIEMAAELGVPYIELHTGTLCDASGREADAELERLIAGAQLAHARGLKVNAGHGITLQTMGQIKQIPWLDTLNIGHSIVCGAVFRGLQVAVEEMRAAMGGYVPGAVDTEL